ncbi:MAG: TRIC cation channel family protein [Actinobacteria bacterium]|nr:TRIC cation channel family protein [Actinomycetota bacterium]
MTPTVMAAELAATAPPQIISLPPLFDALAITVGALAGALYATRKGFDFLGIVAIAFLSGLGGGVIRDVVLQFGTPAFLANPWFLIYAASGALIGFFFAKKAQTWGFAYNALDVATMGVWVLLGCQKSLQLGLPAVSVVFVGVLASVGGGLLMNLLCGEVPTSFQPGHWHAFAAMLASITYVTLARAGAPPLTAEAATLATAAVLKWSAVRFDIRTPAPIDLSEVVRERLARRRKPVDPSIPSG